jgi:hypothetical protein
MSDTTTLYWPRNSTFLDGYAGLRFPGEGAYEVPTDHVAHYRNRGWTDVPDDYDGGVDQPGNARSPRMDSPARDEMEGSDPGGSGN